MIYIYIYIIRTLERTNDRTNDECTNMLMLIQTGHACDNVECMPDVPRELRSTSCDFSMSFNQGDAFSY